MRKFGLINRASGLFASNTHTEEWVRTYYIGNILKTFELVELTPRTVETKVVTTKEII